MVTVSPPVSPSVVAAILMIQKTRVTAGTLLRASFLNASFIGVPDLLLRGWPARRGSRDTQTGERRRRETARPAHCRSLSSVVGDVDLPDLAGWTGGERNIRQGH